MDKHSKISITYEYSAKLDFDCLCQNITSINKSNIRREKNK
jgi:hypothetical protein